MKKTLKVGTLLKSEKFTYEVESVLGAGAFGITYKAKTHVTIGNVTHTVHYAIKEFFVTAACSRAEDGRVVVNTAQKDLYSTQLAAFKREARMLYDMPRHQGIVSVNELMDAFNTSYYVMEYLGESLAHYIETAPNHILPEQKALNIFLDIAQAVAFLHSHHRLHLDIKPDNIMLHEEHPKLIDFGQSRVFDGKETGRPKECVSHGFSPLEQYSGITHFAPSADIYALGATLLYMLSGKHPVEAKDMSVEYIDSVLPPGIGVETRQVLHKCLAREPHQRGERVSDILSTLGYIIPDDNNTTLVGEETRSNSPKIRLYTIKRKALVPILIIAAVAIVVCLIFIIPAGVEQNNCIGGSDSATVPDDTVMTHLNSNKDSLTKTINTKADDTVNIKSTSRVIDTKETVTDKGKNIGTKEILSSKTPALDYASWSGRVKNGEPDGTGIMTFTRSHIIPGTSIRANAGDVLEGTFSKGRLVNGELNGKYIEIED